MRFIDWMAWPAPPLIKLSVAPNAVTRRLPSAMSPTTAEAFAETYAGEPFVRVPRKRLPEVVAVAGSNHAEVAFELGEPVGGVRRVACFSAIDNLIKGGAGQAIQNMNLMLGLDERLTLEDPGAWP